jgi:prepilin-type N-terminal cleavage/methylation domain-containing protein
LEKENGREADMDGKRGFTLIELMIVVTIIAIIAAIALPNLLRSRLSANEANAIGSIRTISTAQFQYICANERLNANGAPLYAPSLNGLENPPSGAPPYIDNVLATGQQHGYVFVTAANDANITYTATGRPQAYGTTGVRSFFTDETGILRFTSANAPATAASTPLN